MDNDYIRNILKTQEQLRTTILPHVRALQTLAENQHMTQINQDIVRQHEKMTAAFGRVEELSRSTGQFNSVLQSIEDRRRIQELVNAVDQRFYLPEVNSAINLLRQLENSALSNMMQRYRVQIPDIHRSFETVNNSWLDSANKLQSLNGFVALTGIGHALNIMPPFEVGLTEALRIDLGDWRNDISWPIGAIVNPIFRTSFYEEQGLNANLTAFPASTFDELVISTGIREHSTHDSDDEYLDHEEEAELESAFERTTMTLTTGYNVSKHRYEHLLTNA